MDGIFLCFHNTREVHGFQYLTLQEMETILFGNEAFAQQAFKVIIKLFQVVLNQITELYPGEVCPISFFE